ncbi:hypothetical protein [Ornithinibacillus xuwenensis]|uniref:Uncharacterized protein n=1 Tax=Ornithinibacillus xuwenensis TaxID=3144668 RepID=A0ABU9XEY7_9BACI
MTKETEKKGLGWFKGNRANTDTAEAWENLIQDKEAVQAQREEEINVPEEVIEQAESANRNIFSKENQDKVSLDLIVAVENMLKDRQLFSYKNNDLEKRLQEAYETSNRYKQDLEKRDQLLTEKNREIEGLENSLANKQMNYDQLLEDYKESQQSTNNEYEKLSTQLETAQDKYNKLNEEFTNSKYDSMLKINELEEKIRSLEIDNNKLATQHQQIVDEKNELMQTINDFTQRMSFSFAPKNNSAASSDQSE